MKKETKNIETEDKTTQTNKSKDKNPETKAPDNILEKISNKIKHLSKNLTSSFKNK